MISEPNWPLDISGVSAIICRDKLCVDFFYFLNALYYHKQSQINKKKTFMLLLIMKLE